MNSRGRKERGKVTSTLSSCISVGKNVYDYVPQTRFFINFIINLNSARYAYENCVGNSALAKCKANSARFTRSLVELLSSERQFKNCAKIEDSLCSAAEKRRSTLRFFLIVYLQARVMKYFHSL